MLAIDGSFGEGGGQILRSSLAMSICTGQPFHIEKIRAGRQKPGLMRQHLTAVKAAAAVCEAKVEGDAIGSQALWFAPGAVRPGDYTFSVGTAGSTTLVLQTVLPALLTSGGPSNLTLEGGTHNPFAPPFDFLVHAFLPLVNRMGPRVTAVLDRPGFYPAGGGRFHVVIEPATKLTGFDLLERGQIKSQKARAILANLPAHIGDRELKVVADRLGWPRECLRVERADHSVGPGNLLTLTVESEHVTEVFTGFGERNRSAQGVAEQAVQQCRRYLAAGVPVGEYLTDQLLLPMALAGAGSFRCAGLSRHAQTHVELIHWFLSTRVTTESQGKSDTLVRIG
ncbi:MAG: RNA 3'-terminal phosphate cyclase [Phycisphaeraceae bacterium]